MILLGVNFISLQGKMQVRKARKPDQLRGKRVPVRLAESIGLDFFAYFFYQEKK